MKYLGLILDSRWGFEEHFSRQVLRIQKVAGALHRLLPNLGGPREEVRRLYAMVVRSIALYGAPVWAARLRVRRCRTMFYSVQRKMAMRIARGYRTISFQAATLLARFPPLDILADMDERVFASSRGVRHSGGNAPLEAPGRVRQAEHRAALETWHERLHEPQSARQRVVGAILPNFWTWVKRGFGRVTYRMTQVLTGHGCFGEYLCRIGREETAQCHHCDGDLDSAQHTLEECPAWDSERQDLVSQVGQDLSPPALVRSMLRGERSWEAVTRFCESVMVRKEEAERERERADPARRRRRR